MKKLLMVLISLLVISLVLVGCAPEEEIDVTSLCCEECAELSENQPDITSCDKIIGLSKECQEFYDYFKGEQDLWERDIEECKLFLGITPLSTPLETDVPTVQQA